jgi:YfiH family protein
MSDGRAAVGAPVPSGSADSSSGSAHSSSGSGPASGESVHGLAFDLPGRGHVLFTERADGNLSSVGGDRAGDAQVARERLRARIGVERLVRGYQEHGAVVRRVLATPPRAAVHEPRVDAAREPRADAARSPRADEPRADGQATALVGVGTMVLAADCLPVALGCEGAVAMVHAGWRGLAAGVLEQGVLALRELAQADEDDPIVAIVGPGAGVCCYEVGAEVRRAFDGAHARGRNIDLRAVARQRLLTAGVERVRDVDTCTICDPRFFSHRREGACAGRHAGVAWLS